jgi:hypothetical protein
MPLTKVPVCHLRVGVLGKESFLFDDIRSISLMRGNEFTEFTGSNHRGACPSSYSQNVCVAVTLVPLCFEGVSENSCHVGGGNRVSMRRHPARTLISKCGVKCDWLAENHVAGLK